MPFKKLISKVKSCFGIKSNKVSPLITNNHFNIVLTPEIEYAWNGHPTATCCKQVYSACFNGHLDCLKLLIDYEHSLFTPEHISHTKSQTCPYFCWMAANGTIEMFHYLLSIGYRPSWSHFLSDLIRYHNLSLLQDIHNAKHIFYLKHIYAHFFEGNLREGDLDDPRVTETFLYFLNHGSREGFWLFQACFPILQIVSRGIKDVPIERFDHLQQATRLIMECLAMVAQRDLTTRRIADRDSLFASHRPIFDKLVAMSFRKDLLVKVMLASDIMTKDLVMYVVSPYLDPY